MSSGVKMRPSKVLKSGTTSTKNHRFESFTQRIAKLKIDPVRRVRRHGLEDEDLSATTSYFKDSLERWVDLNLSENFTDFARSAKPLCESLPQLLHYQDRVMGMLAEYIGKMDALSLEPLLSLLGHFAHDLGAQFEPHFPATVDLVASVAAKHPDVEVIEWAFTCLAWLFKYLSRLLVPDLRPLYEILAPLLGREHQKLFIVRFAAEALSFLVRKAGALYFKNKTPLEIIIQHAFEDLRKTAETRDVQFYQRGLMTLFASSVKGVKRGLHSSGVAVIRSLLNNITKEDRSYGSWAKEVFCGVLINLIHHTDADGFKEIMEAVLDGVQDISLHPRPGTLAFGGRLLFIMASVRKGSRIQDWQPMLEKLKHLLTSTTILSHAAVDDVAAHILPAAATILQSSPLDIILPHLREIMQIITDERLQEHFLTFCDYFAQMESERFRSFLLPELQSFMIKHWIQSEDQLCVLLPKLHSRDCLVKTLICPLAWQEQISTKFAASLESEETPQKCSAYLDLVDIILFEQRVLEQLVESLERHARLCLSSSQGANGNDALFGAGRGLLSYVKHARIRGDLDVSLWPLLCSSAPQYRRLPLFLESVFEYTTTIPGQLDLSAGTVQSLVDSLIGNLTTPSHDVRVLSLRVLSTIYTQQHQQDSEPIAIALRIENTPVTLQTARSASMYIRKLGSLYDTVSTDGDMRKIIPYYCFGLLTMQSSQIWEDAKSALKVICENRIGEGVVSELVFSWLDLQTRIDTSKTSSPTEPPQKMTLTEFQCSNLALLEGLISGAQKEMKDATEVIADKFREVHRISPSMSSTARVQALDVLNCVPYIAEKRSRILVPLLLSWTSHRVEDATAPSKESPIVSASTVGGASSVAWTLREKMALLGLFGQFGNPSVLYRSAEAYDALVSLLANGDVEIQRRALKAIFAWKSAALRPYEENLFNVLDDARFREEISNLTSGQENLSMIQTERREALMPVLLRLLYGKIVAKTGSTSGRRGQESKRRAVLTALALFGDQELALFLSIVLGPLDSFPIFDGTQLLETSLDQERLSVRKQVGLVKMLEDMLGILGNRVKPLADKVLNAVLYCLIRASRGMSKAAGAEEERPGVESQLSMLKTIRQIGSKCLNMHFKVFPGFGWQPYIPAILAELIIPRLDRLSIDTAQAVSVLLQLFSIWSSSQDTVFLLATDDGIILHKVAECLEVPSAKDEVKLFVLEDILQNVINLAKGPLDGNNDMRTEELRDRINQQILGPNIDCFLIQIGSLLRKSPSKELLGSGVRVVSQLAEFIKDSSQARNFIELTTFLLVQPVHRVNPRMKGDLLRILQHFVPLYDFSENQDLYARIFHTISSLFGYFIDRTSRETLCRVLAVLAQKDQELAGVAELCTELNSFSAHSLDEPDFDRRLRAFSLINEKQYNDFTLKQWRPILFNALYYVKDEKELAIRTNASLTLRRFIKSITLDSNSTSPAALELLRSHLLPSLRKGAHEASELVRAEYLAVMASLVKAGSICPEVIDLRVLLVDDDEEASFFSNVLHIQQHRRLRALRRLASEARQGYFTSTNITQFFVPLIEHFIFDKADDDSAHNLAAEAILTVGALAEWVEWPQFRAMFRRFCGYMQSKAEMEKAIIKLLGMMIDALGRAAMVKNVQLLSCTAQEDLSAVAGIADANKGVLDRSFPSTLATTIPKQQKLSDDLTKHLLPPLTGYLHKKDESTVSLRVPVAVAIVKLLKLLPHEQLSLGLPPVLTDLCHILRSKSQESRDMTRRTLAEISTLIGPSYFGFVLKELRGALARGYQLHVLSYTVHSILVATAPAFESGDLDYCMPQLVSVIMDDIFGVTGQEKDAEEYISKMKEVKSSKSYDSMELIAKTTTLQRLSDLIRPLQTLLQEKLTLKLVKKIDELLRRVGVGLLRNEAIQSRQLLVFCYEVIQEVYKVASASRSSNDKEDYRTKRYLINLKGSNKNERRGGTSSYTYKLARFSLDVLRSTLHKHDALQTPSNLIGFLPIIGDAIVQSQEEVQISAIRLLTAIIKVPLPQLDQTAVVAAAESVKMIKASTSTNTEIAQASLKLISAILRERRQVIIRESDIAYLLIRLKPDLEEPNRQGVTFNFLKAVITRKIIIPEVYEVLDIVAAIMVTNQTRGARDLARGVYFQFLMDYPQNKDRFSKQLGFLVKNLDYKHQEGRQSVMEAVHLLLTKIGQDLTQDIIAMFFIPLNMVLINDESAECREMAGALLKVLFERADVERTRTLLSLLRSWVSQVEQPLLTRAALQNYRIYFGLNTGKSDKQRIYVQTRVLDILTISAADAATADWELVYFALQTITTFCQISPKDLFVTDSEPLWTQVRLYLSFPHAWVKLAAAKLIGAYIADFGRANAETGLGKLPLIGTASLKLTTEDILQLARTSLGILRVSGVSEELATQSVRNLVFLGRCMAANDLIWNNSSVSEQPVGAEEDSEDEQDGSIDSPVRSKERKPAVKFLFERLSAILRRETLTTRAPSLIPKTASLQLVAALCNHLPLSILSPCLQTVLLPLHNLTDTSIPAPYSVDPAFTEAYKALVLTSQEIMALLQKKVGTTEFVAQLTIVREGVKARREGRRVKRRIEAVAEPEKVGRDKKRKGEKKREKRKERSGEERARRRGW